MTQLLRTAFIGLNPDSHWAATAHMPALKTLSDRFEVVGVANSSAESSRRSAEAFGLAHAFNDADELVSSDEVDLVVVTVKVPHHRALVSKAIEAGKNVYCEWPLGNGLGEAEELEALAAHKRVVAAVGTQLSVAPEILYLKRLVAEGFVGKVLSTSIVADAGAWGAETTADIGYIYDSANGATILSIPMGHTLAGLREVLGEVGAVSARFTMLGSEVAYTDKGGTLIRTSPEDVIVMGGLESGAALSMHYRGGSSRGTGLIWKIHGSDGDIEITGASGHTQMVQLTLRGARGADRDLEPLTLPASSFAGLPETATARNVACVYSRIADDITNGSRTAPTFAEAVELHRLLNRIECAAQTKTEQ